MWKVEEEKLVKGLGIYEKRRKSCNALGGAWKEFPSVSEFQDGEHQKEEGS